MSDPVPATRFPTASVPEDDPELRDRRRGLLAGAIASLAMLVTTIVLHAITDVTSILDVLADALLLFLPLGLFSGMLTTFGAQAKTLLLLGLLLVLIAIGAWFGRIVARQTYPTFRIPWRHSLGWGLGYFLLLTLFTALFVTERTPAFTGGADILIVLRNLAIAMLVYALVLGPVLTLLRHQDAPASLRIEPVAPTTSRRRFLTRAGLAIASLAGIGVLGRDVWTLATRKTFTLGTRGVMPSAITPNNQFYVISKNFTDPDPDRGDDWSLTIDGLVETPLTVTHADLEALGVETFTSTLTCISNPIAGPLIGTAVWTGVPLAKVLALAGVQDGAFKLIAEGEDGYSDSFPIERARSAEPHIVWEMNGEALHRLHGTPVRLIVPGLYGIKNVKWLTKLTVTAEDYHGYWQERGWTDTAIIKTESRIDVPGDRQVIAAGPTEIGGMAFAGDRGITKVEVSTDDGETWIEATITENPSPEGLSWVLWTAPWSPEPGAYRLKVRATDGTGELQTEESAPELPDGASGWHTITVGVA